MSYSEVAMKTIQKALRRCFCLCAVALIATTPAVIAQDEAGGESLTVDEYVERARPYLHLSCQGAWEQVNGDGEAYVAIIDKLSAIGFINHEFDVKRLEALPEPDLEAVRVGYYNEVGRACKENPKLLLAGVVEQALIDELTKLKPRSEGE
jgi:hypothetical protein